jgi:hypothetical protein
VIQIQPLLAPLPFKEVIADVLKVEAAGANSAKDEESKG